jgi:hypothetical protein
MGAPFPRTIDQQLAYVAEQINLLEEVRDRRRADDLASTAGGGRTDSFIGSDKEAELNRLYEEYNYWLDRKKGVYNPIQRRIGAIRIRESW